MTKYETLLKQLEADKEALDSFGEYIIKEVQDYIKAKIPHLNIDYFFKVKPSCRIKESKSIIDKAYFRGKQYTDPYNDITDKIGVRFIVLTMEDVKLLEEAIINIKSTSHSKDRDSISERFKNPSIFTYQSDHYVLRPDEELTHNGKVIKKEISCEVQARTLLQHAYAEVSHLTTYKPKLSASLADVQLTERELARASCLVEVTDDKFNRVMTDFQNRTKITGVLLKQLHKIYSNNINKQVGPVGKSDELLIESFYDYLGDNTEQDLVDFYKSSGNSYIFNKIKQRTESNYLYQQPSILFLYYILDKIDADDFADLYPLGLSSLAELFNDLGKSTDPYIQH